MSILVFAILEISKQYNKVFNNSEVLWARGTACMNCNRYEKLLYITSKQFVFIQRNAKGNKNKTKPKKGTFIRKRTSNLNKEKDLSSYFSSIHCFTIFHIYSMVGVYKE